MEAMAAASAAQLAEAVSVLYGDPNPMRKAEANAWLVAFSNSTHAWGVAAGLLETESVEVRYFCANMLLSKVHNEWSHLASDARSSLTGHLCRILATYMADPTAPNVVVNRVCLILAAIAGRAGPIAGQQEPSMNFTTAALVENALQAAAAASSDERGEQTMAVVLALLQAVAEETETLDRVRRTPALEAMKARRKEVLSMLEVRLANPILASWQATSGPAVGGTNHSRLLVPLLQLVHAWLKADTADSSSLYLTAGELSTSHEALWRLLLLNLGSTELLASEAAVETVVDLLSVWEHGGGPGGSSSVEAAEITASRMVFQAILAQRAKLAGEPGVQGFRDETPVEEMERGLCRVAVAAAENSTELIASETGACDEAIPLAEMMLECAGRGDKAVIEAVVEMFTMLNTVPVAERKAEFRAPLYGKLMQVLVEKAAYPMDFTSWEEAVDDEDSFHRFRDQVVADGLETCANLLQSQYLEYVGAHLERAATWQQAEAALYSVRCISQSMRAKVLEAQRRKGVSEAERRAAEAFLGGLFLRLAHDPAGGLFSSHPLLVESVARLVGAYAPWFAAHPEALEGILSGLLRALQVPSALKQAAHAFRSICARCTAHLKAPELLQRLIDAAESALPPMPDTWPAAAAAGPQYLDERSAVVEGLARITSALPPEAVLSLTARLASPMIARALHLAGDVGDHSPPSEAQSAALATQLKLLSAAVRFLEVSDHPGTNQRARGGVLRGPPAGAIWPAEQLSQVGMAANQQPPAGGGNEAGRDKPQHPCLVVMEMAWPVLAGILGSPRWRADPDVVEALCDVYRRSLLCVKSAALPLIPSLIPLVGLFEEQQHAACLEVLATAMEICSSSAGSPGGAEGSKLEGSVFQMALETTCRAAFALVQRGGLPHRPEVLQSLFEMAYRYLLFLPALLLSSPVLPGLLQTAAAVVRSQERASSKTALAFVGHLLAPGEKALGSEPWQKNRRQIDACLQQQGEVLTGALLYAAGDTLARDLIRTVASILYALISLYHSAAATWLVKALSDPHFPGVVCGATGDSEMRMFCEIALRQPPLPRPRFEAMMADFANVCRREGTSDLLVAYQM